MGERLPRFTSPSRSSSGKDGGARSSDDDDSSSGMEFGSPARVDAGGSLARWTRITDGHTGEYVDESVKTAEGGLVELKKKKVDDSRLQIQQHYTNSAGEAVTQFKCSYSQRLGCPYQARMKVGGRADDCIELSERYDHDHGSADKNVRGIDFKLERWIATNFIVENSALRPMRYIKMAVTSKLLPDYDDASHKKKAQKMTAYVNRHRKTRREDGTATRESLAALVRNMHQLRLGPLAPNGDLDSLGHLKKVFYIILESY